MAEATQALNILVTGGAEGAGLATARALLQRGHKVAATACDADGALAVRIAGALPVFPDLARASEILSILQMTKADAVVHAGPQYFGGAPHAAAEYASCADQLVEYSAAVTEAAKEHRVKRFVSLSFGYLYDAGQGAAKEGDHDAHDRVYAPMLAAEACARESGLNGYLIRSGYIYGGHSAATAALAEAIKGSRRLTPGDRPASWIHEDDLASAIASLLETDSEPDGIEMINAAANAAASPDEFSAAVSSALGLSEPRFASSGFLSMLREQSLRDKLMAREIIIDSSQIRERFAWQPRHESVESGLETTALVWRMKDAVQADSFYRYEDAARSAIESFAYDVALPEPAAAQAEPAAEVQAAPEPAPVKAAAPPPTSDGPTPWNEDEAKREERRRRALERKAKRAAKSAGG
ncbi:MAG: NAD(P)-dependent oxidoreductase [Chloroflexi bacterium]|nr:NAD(P)-dependent oxidoreductase [Chloroflexota bacterium]